ncbi:unnamed protein product [Periconia digitata]|uniref:Uncharacterized protein n=1 Tax=Periconia digitata TaxID=1303443 RepID=A0A9W4U669_9PLEO|nr:unnamed protein product [Periconia digitata]
MYPALSTIEAELNGGKWGFVIFRCAYGDDASWKRFLGYLQAKYRYALALEGADRLYEQLDWTIQEDSALDGADAEVVKVIFQEWLEQHKDDESVGHTRARACIMIDQDVLDDLGYVYEYAQDIEEYDEEAFVWVHLISSEDDEKPTKVGVDYLMPNAYVNINIEGWEAVERKDGEEVAKPS